jgi:glycosyltransferase involved in cell wall biosynthesis
VRLLREGWRRDFDVVEGSNYVVFPVAWLLARLKGRRVVWFYPDVLIGQWRSGRFGGAGIVGEIVERALLRLPVDRYIAISNTVAERLVAQSVPRARIALIPCGFPECEAELARKYPESFTTPTIVTANRLVSYKRTDLVVRALAHPALTGTRLVIIGMGPEMSSLQDLAVDLGVRDRVEFRGHVGSHQDVLRAIAGADVFVSASEIEGFGIVIVEAMALGTPYVASNIPAFREVTSDGIGGRLFTADSSDSLAAAAAEILGNPTLRQRLAGEGRAHSAGLTWTAIAERTLAEYRCVLGQFDRPE